MLDSGLCELAHEKHRQGMQIQVKSHMTRKTYSNVCASLCMCSYIKANPNLTAASDLVLPGMDGWIDRQIENFLLNSWYLGMLWI